MQRRSDSGCDGAGSARAIHRVGFRSRRERNALVGVSVEVWSTLDDVRTGVTNANGYYSVTGVSGPMSFRVYADGYSSFLQTVVFTRDIELNVQLTLLAEAESIRLGEIIDSFVPNGAPPCDPAGWDAQAPCKRFRLTVPATGTLVMSIKWEGGPELDATIVIPRSRYTYVGTSSPTGPFGALLRAPVTAGQLYEVHVYAYYSGQAFVLTADLDGSRQQ